MKTKSRTNSRGIRKSLMVCDLFGIIKNFDLVLKRFSNNSEARRKSNVVKEIEKIKQNREVRRAKQEEKRTAVNNVDTSVPAWEFSQMINDFRSHIEFTKLSNSEPVQDLRISVCVRKRPINKKGLLIVSIRFF